MGIEDDVASLTQAFGQLFTRENDVHHGANFVDEGVGCHHVEAGHAPNEVGLNFVGGVHDGQSKDIELLELSRCFPVHMTMETGGRKERKTLDAGCIKVMEPTAWNGVGVA